MAKIDDSLLQGIITGRVEPHIYSFETNTLPNYLKVGDTYRPVDERLNEWRKYYKDLTEVSRHKAIAAEGVFFRDYSVHKHLRSKGKVQANFDPVSNFYSAEFFSDTKKTDVEQAVEQIVKSYPESSIYDYYHNLKDRIEYRFTRNKDFAPRDNQQEVINRFKEAVNAGRANLLMYAVMRFGKSITSIWAAKQIDSKLTVVVSAKADVRLEWKQTVESHKDFAGYRFMDSEDLRQSPDIEQLYGQTFKAGSETEEVCTNIVLFLTLQDLAGSTAAIKKRHEFLQEANVDLLIIDETHFGARAQVLGKILAGTEISDVDKEMLSTMEDQDDIGKPKELKAINAKVKLHLSGTPYRILMGSEFEPEDIIAFVQFSDIYEAKLKWATDNLETDEWHNPYYGFPQMVRFAFNPNESSRKLLDGIPGSKPSDLLAPISTSSSNPNYETFQHEQEVLELFGALDGSLSDTQLLGVLDSPIIKNGKLARHIVIVLPFRASCDALEKLLVSNKDEFRNIAEYRLFNISGHNKELSTPEEVKAAISNAEADGDKTITLTVNKMLTGSTVPQWDTMIYLKGTASPQEYDQAVFRLQSPWVEVYEDGEGNRIAYDMKPQTLLVDLDPTRLFSLQEAKAFTYGANAGQIGNEQIESFIERELKISPIIAVNTENNKLVEINATNVMDQVRDYAASRTIVEDVGDVGVDLTLFDNEEILAMISSLSEMGGRNGLNIRPAEDEGQELDITEEVDDHASGDDPTLDPTTTGTPAPTSDSETAASNSSLEKKFRSYYAQILLYAFLTDTEVKNLSSVIASIEANDDNRRIAKNLGLRASDLQLIRDNVNWSVLRSLDYKIQNTDYRAIDESISPEEHIEIAISKFGRLSESEIFTPAIIANKIFEGFDSDFWDSLNSEIVLDMASKSGSFAHAFVLVAEENGASRVDLRDRFYSIPTSPAAYEFTLKMYKAIGLNSHNIAQHFNSYDLLKLSADDVNFLLTQDKNFDDIKLSDLENRNRDSIKGNNAGVNQVRFKAIVGNPPYQENIKNRGDQPPIYHHFLETAYNLSDIVSMIHPARFLFNAGLTPRDWNQKMLNDKHLKVAYFEQKSMNVFPNTDIKGGIAITLRDTSKDFGAIKVFTSLPELNSILNKVEPQTIDTLDKHITGRGVYRLTEDALRDHPEIERLQSVGHKTDVGSGALRVLKGIVLFENKPIDENEYVQVIGLLDNRRVYYWIDQRYLSQPKNFKKYKIIVPKANGSGAIGEILSTPLIGEPLIGYTETFIGIGEFSAEVEARAALKYVKSKFARTLLGVLKITQDNPRGKWAKVPYQDFTSASDIDWTRSVAEIDRQLYAKYNLSPQEIEFIEARVKAME